jgi:tetratricopeptide (TPR) repeat protein
MRKMNGKNLLASLALIPLFAAPAAAVKKSEPKKGPIDEVSEKYNAARTPAKGQPPVPVVLSPGDCKSFAKDFQSAAGKEKAREVEGLFNAGVVLDQCGLLKEAEEMYNKALAKNPKFAPALNNLGVIYQNTGRQNLALAKFDEAIRADAKSALAVQAYNNKGALLYERARQAGGAGNPAAYTEAIGSLRRALAVDANSIQAYHFLALIYYQTAEQDRSKLRLAQLVCDEARKISDDYAPIYNTLGLIKLRQKDVTGALNDFRKAASLDPGLVEAQLNIAAISLSARSYKQAEDAFQAVLKKQPNNLDAIIGMGVAVRGQRRMDEAETWYKKAQQIDPRSCAPLYNLGLLYQDYKSGNENELRRAQEYYNKYISCPSRTDADKVSDSRRRIKDIDDTFKAIEEQKKLEIELKKQQEEMERQQKAMEEEMKKRGEAPPPAAK